VAFELKYGGSYDSTFDEKGRVIIPAPLRNQYSGELIVTQGNKDCVWIMRPDAWNEFVEKLEKISKNSETEVYNELQLRYVYPARVAKVDKDSGRIAIAHSVRKYAGLLNIKDCIVINARNHLEIWDSQCYYDCLKAMEGKPRIEIGAAFFKFDEEEDKV